ncbi:MAG: hypothetical protein IPL61_00065 [Myxococcales bacterium]|nr:hypothetical protein [Myxococcales bacterium]
MRTALVLVVALAGCGSKKPAPPPEEDEGPRGTLVGIDPDRWSCEVVATIAAVGEVLAGPVRQVEGSMAPPRGVPRPCNYILESTPTPEAWTWDLDCRKGALRTAETLWQQYTAQNEALVAAVSDAAEAERKDDAGVIHAPPTPAQEVAVGAKGLDHNGQAVLFVDDDTPCYGRIVGPDPARRLALAQLIAGNLRPSTAPMEPRAAGK